MADTGLTVKITGDSADAKKALAEASGGFDELRKRVEAARQAFAQLDVEAKNFASISADLKSLGSGAAGLTLTAKQTGELGDKLAGLDSGLSRISPTAANVAAGLGSFAKTAGVALGGIAVAGVAVQQGFEKVFGSTMRAADAIKQISDRSGIATEEIQRLGYAASQNGSSTEAMGGALKFLAKNIDDAGRGSKEANEAFARMGISIRDSSGNMKDTTQVFYEVSDAIARSTSGTERQSLAMSLLGRAGADMVPLLAQGSREIRKLGDEAEAVGAVMSGKAIQAIDDYKDAMEAFELSALKLKSNILEKILPSFTEWIGGFLDITSAGKRGEEALSHFWATLASGAANLTPLTALLKYFGMFRDSLSEADAEAQNLALSLSEAALENARRMGVDTTEIEKNIEVRRKALAVEREIAKERTASAYVNTQINIQANRSRVSMEQARTGLEDLKKWAETNAPKMMNEITTAQNNLYDEMKAASKKAVETNAKNLKEQIQKSIEAFVETTQLDASEKMSYLGKKMAEAQANGFEEEAKKAKEGMKKVVSEQLQSIRDEIEGDGELQRTARIKQYERLLKLAQEHGVATRDIEKAISAERKAIRADDGNSAVAQERATGSGRVAEIQAAGQQMAAAERAAGQKRAAAIREAAELAAEAKIGGEISGSPKGAGAGAGAGAGVGAGAAGAGPLSDADLDRAKRNAEMEANRLRNTAKTDAEKAAADAAAAKAAGLAKEVQARKEAGKQEGKIDAELAAARKKASDAQLEANRKLNAAKKSGTDADKQAAADAAKAAKAAQKAADDLAAAQKKAGDAGEKAGEDAAEGMGKAKDALDAAAGAAAGGPKGGGGGGPGGPPGQGLAGALGEAEAAKDSLVEDIKKKVPEAEKTIESAGKAADGLAESLGKADSAVSGKGGGGGGGSPLIDLAAAGRGIGLGTSMGAAESGGGAAQTPAGGGADPAPRPGGGGGPLTTTTPDGQVLRPRVVNGVTVWEPDTAATAGAITTPQTAVRANVLNEYGAVTRVTLGAAAITSPAVTVTAKEVTVKSPPTPATDWSKYAGQLATTGMAEEISADMARGKPLTKIQKTLDTIAFALTKPITNIEKIQITPTVNTVQAADPDAIGRQIGRAFLAELRKPDRSPF